MPENQLPMLILRNMNNSRESSTPLMLPNSLVDLVLRSTGPVLLPLEATNNHPCSTTTKERWMMKISTLEQFVVLKESL